MLPKLVKNAKNQCQDKIKSYFEMDFLNHRFNFISLRCQTGVTGFDSL